MPKNRKIPGVSRRYVRRAARVLAAAAGLSVYALAPLSGRWPLAAATLAAATVAYYATTRALSAIGSAALNRTGK